MFITNYIVELSKTWTTLNNHGIHHTIVYNKVEDHPLVISGWKVLENYYNFPEDVVVVVGYCGEDKFGIIGFKQVTQLEELPRFHSRYLFHEGLYAFDVNLAPNSVALPKLVEFNDIDFFII